MLENVIYVIGGVIFGAVAVTVYVCCRLSGDIARKVERWSDDE